LTHVTMHSLLILTQLLFALICVRGDHHSGHHDDHHEGSGHHDHHSSSGHHDGGHHAGRGLRHMTHDDLFSLIHESGIHVHDEPPMSDGHRQIFASRGWNSSTLVKSGDSSELIPSASYFLFMYIRGHMSGSSWGRYEDDVMLSWNAGGTLLLHLIFPDGRHEEHLIGNTQENHEAKYIVIVPGGSYHAVELRSGDFVIITDLQSPVMSFNKFHDPSESDMVRDFPQYESMIRRLAHIRKDDTNLEVPAASSHDHGAHQGHDHHDQHHDQHHDDHHGGSGHHDMGHHDSHP